MFKFICKIVCILICTNSLNAANLPNLPNFNLPKFISKPFEVGKFTDKISNLGSSFGGKLKVPQLNLNTVSQHLTIADGGAAGKVFQNGVTESASSFNNGFFKGKCSSSLPKISGVGNNLGDVCDMLTGAVGNAFAPLQELLRNGIDVGFCSLGTEFNYKKCIMKWTKEYCEEVKGKAKSIVNDTKAIIKKGWDNSGATGLIDQARSTVNDIYGDVKQNVSELSKKFKTAVALDETIKRKLRGEDCEEDDIMKTPMGDSNSLSVEDTLNAEAFARSVITSPKNGGSTMAAEVTFQCIKALPKQKGTYDFVIPDGKGGFYKDEEKLQVAMRLCNPAYLKRGKASDIFKKTVDLAKDISQETNVNFFHSIALSGELRKTLTNECGQYSDFAEAKLCEQRILDSSNADPQSIAHKLNVLEKQNIRQIEDQSSKMLAMLDEIYPNEIQDTSDETLEKLLPSQRAYFLHQARKQDLQNAMIISFADRIAQSKKELARITMVKIKECSTPFYYASAVQDTIDNIANARQDAQDTVSSILSD